MTSEDDDDRSAPINERFREPADFSTTAILQKDNIKLVWIDRHWKDGDLGPQLRTNDSSLPSFDNVTTAIEYLSSVKNSFYFFVIISGEFCERIIDLLESLPHVYYVFVYCLNVAKYEHLKERSSKIYAICSTPEQLISSVEKVQNSTTLSITKQYSMRNLDKDLATFIWFQLLKSLLERLTSDNEEMAMNDLREQVKEHYHDNETQRKNLLSDLEGYDPDYAVWWYTGAASLSIVVNEALRKQDIDLLFKCRQFVRDLSNWLTEERRKKPFAALVYRGAYLPKESFNKLKYAARERAIVSTNGYLSTSKKPESAKMFLTAPKDSNIENNVSVMYEIDIDNDPDVIAVDISQVSQFSDEEEVLFDMDSTFEILKVNFEEKDQLWTIRMRAVTHGRELAKEYIRYNEGELDRLSVELLFGRLMTDMGEFEKSIKYFERLNGRENVNQTDVHINLGRVYALNGSHDTAKKHYDIAKDLEKDENSIKMAEIENQLGWLDNTLGHYRSAIEKYRKSLELCNASQSHRCWRIKGEIRANIVMAQATLGLFEEAEEELKTSRECMLKAQLPENHAELSQLEINLGRNYQRFGNYEKAKEHCKKALEMRRNALPSGHLDIGKALHRLGSVTGEEGKDYEEALGYFREALIINENAVGREHPETIHVLGDIANVYECRDEHDLALKYQLKALELYEKVYDHKDHEDTARVLSNIGELYRRMKNYEKAFEYSKRGLEMRKIVLGDDHFDVGTVYVNLAETYRDTYDYQTAMQYAEKGIELWRRKLSPSAIYMDEGEALLVELRRLLSENDPADRNNS